MNTDLQNCLLAAFVTAFSLLAGTGCDRSDAPATEEWPLPCEFASFDSTAGKLARCAVRDDSGGMVFRPDLLADIDAGSGIQSVHVDDGWYFVTREKIAQALTYDNGADYFQEGLARIVHNGKIGYVDQALEIVVTPEWDFAFPFSDGFAVVCMGCREEPAGEHTNIAGGGWGYIDAMGNVVLAPVYQRDSLPPPPDAIP